MKTAISDLAEDFDYLCREGVQNAEKLRRKFLKIDFGWEMVCATTWEHDDQSKVTLAKYFPGDEITSARVVIYRGPIQFRAQNTQQQMQLIRKIITPIVQDAVKMPRVHRAKLSARC
jgi:hypothetical protein